MRLAVLTLVLWLACMKVVPSAKQASQTDFNRSGEQTFRSSTNLVLVNVVAVNSKTGVPERTFRREDFQVLDNGHDVSIRTFDSQLQSRPLSLWFVVQCNMQGWAKQGSGLFAGKENLLAPALTGLDTRDTVALAHFCDDGRSQLDLLPTSDTRQAIGALEHVLAPILPLASHGRTGELALQQTLQLIVDATGRSPVKSLPVIIFLFGDWSGMPKVEADGFINELLSTSVIAYGLRDSQSPQIREVTWLGGEQASIANHVATQTGGQYFKVPPKEYATALATILQQLHFRYELGFAPETSDRRPHKLVVRLTDRGKVGHKNVRVRYRAGYVPIPPENR